MKHDPFEGLQELYALHRPRYPVSSFVAIREYHQASRAKYSELGLILLDIGCGTGISTRMLRDVFGTDVTIVGIERSEAMIAKARHTTPISYAVEYIEGVAEDIPFEADSIALILAAQSVQWFDRHAFNMKSVKLLREGGTLGVVQNNRSWTSSEFLCEYELLLENLSPGYSRHYREIDIVREWGNVPQLGAIRYHEFEWTRKLLADQFVGSSLSSTKVGAAVERHGEAHVRSAIQRLVENYLNAEGEIAVDYQTELFLATKQ